MSTEAHRPPKITIPENDGAAVHSSSQPSTPATPFHLKEGQPMALSWHNLVFEVEEKKGLCGGEAHKKQIVKGTSGKFRPGTLTALMGPSGAGKTTMMNVLAGRAPYGEIAQGKVVLNNKEANPADYQRHLAYVMQQDAMFATQTPREALTFTAALRLPEFSEEERTAIVNQALQALRLEHCADTYIGSVLIPGLSGGEKKRAAVAIELISSPTLIFMDEPTSGLDSHSAHELVMILRSLAESGCTVVCTIHQPSSEVFDLFHEVVYLHSGQIVYHGPVHDVADYFENDEYRCGEDTNPSDFAMMRIQNMELTEVAQLVAKVPEVPEPEINGKLQASDLKSIVIAGPPTQFLYLMKREFWQLVRDVPTLIARFGMALIFGLLIGVVYFDVGSEWGTDGSRIARAINDHWGAVVFFTINTTFLAAQPMVLAFPLERSAFLREYTSGTYSSWVYVLTKSLIDIPAAALQSLLGLTPFYFLAQLEGNFGALLGSCLTLAAVSASLGLVLGASTTTAESAMNLLPALYVPQIMFCGFFTASDDIPVFLRWVQYICPLKYGVGMVSAAEFAESLIPSDGNETLEHLRRVQVTDRLNDAALSRDQWWVYLLIMVGMCIGLRVLCCIVLTVRARSFG